VPPLIVDGEAMRKKKAKTAKSILSFFPRSFSFRANEGIHSRFFGFGRRRRKKTTKSTWRTRGRGESMRHPITMEAKSHHHLSRSDNDRRKRSLKVSGSGSKKYRIHSKTPGQ
jgi:hypothetical protein